MGLFDSVSQRVQQEKEKLADDSHNVPDDTHVSFPDDAYSYDVVYSYTFEDDGSVIPHKYEYSVVTSGDNTVLFVGRTWGKEKQIAFEEAKVKVRNQIREHLRTLETPSTWSETITKDNIDY
jgi:hypothetical protein